MKRALAATRQIVEVTVNQGTLRGRRVTPPNGAPSFDAFLGVPYAKPPVDKLRFKAPQASEPWAGVRDALDHARLPVQVDFYDKKLTGSEDCLYVNVYCPGDKVRSVSDGPLPVVVCLPYGAFVFCNPGMREFGPEYLLAKGVIVVTVAYRVNVFGFLSLGSKTIPGNYGIKDTIAALRWVRENIDSFGGDPNRVTLYGPSAGGIIGHTLQYSEAPRGLFQQAFYHGATANCHWASFLEKDAARLVALRLCRKLGCRSENDEEIQDFLQSIPALDLFAATNGIESEIWDEPGGPKSHQHINLAFYPTNDDGTEGSGEDMVLPGIPRDLLYGQYFHPVPTVFGFAKDEGNLIGGIKGFWQGTHCNEENMALLKADIERAVPHDLGLEPGSSASRRVAQGIRELYFPDGEVNRDSYLKMMGDQILTYNILEAARMHAAHPAAASSPVYVYEFAYEGGSRRISDKFQSGSGVNHVDDIGYIWGSRSPISDSSFDTGSSDQKTRDRMTSLLANFARNGDPTATRGQDRNTNGIRWTPTSSEPSDPVSYLKIGRDLIFQSGYRRKYMDYWDSIYRKYYPVPQERLSDESALSV